MKFFYSAVFLFLFCPFSLWANDATLILDDEQLAMDCKISLMMKAKHSISLSYYAINEDEVGLKYAAIACYKAKQGVDVKIIIEKSKSKFTRNLALLFKEYGIELKYYNSFQLHNIFKNFSWLHDKLLVVDSSYVVVGGRNLNNKYYPNSVSATELVDIETLLKGKTGADAQKYVHHLYHSNFASDVKDKQIDTVRYLYLKSVIKRNIDSIRELPYRNWDSLMSPVKEAHFYRDNYKKWPKSQRVSRMVLRLINNSKKELMIVSPYLIPPLKCMRALKAAKKRGVDITLISNSPQISDAKIIAAAYMNDRRKYLKRNFKVYEYNGKKMLHDKIFMADDNTTIVGSFNFDNISYRMNAEIIAEIKDTDFAVKMNQHIQKRKLDCMQILKVKDKNPNNEASTAKKTKGNQMLLRIFPFIRRFL